MIGESLVKNCITGLNYFRDLSSLLDHRLRICAWCRMKPKSSQCQKREGATWVICVGLLAWIIHIASWDKQ